MKHLSLGEKTGVQVQLDFDEEELRTKIWDIVRAAPGIRKETLTEKVNQTGRFQMKERDVRKIIHNMRVDPLEPRIIIGKLGYRAITCRTDWNAFLEWQRQEYNRAISTITSYYRATKKGLRFFGIGGEDLFLENEELRVEVREKEPQSDGLDG